MREVNIKQFRANVRKELTDLPFEITNRDKVIATVLTGRITEQAGEINEQEKEEPTKIEWVKKVKESNKQDGVGGFCPKHKGSIYLTCGCKPKE